MSSFNAPPPPPPMGAGPGPGMAQCSVTGKWVPEDEIVTLHGQRVCAEGKAVLLERLRSGESMPGELEKPGVLRRLGSLILDGIIIGIPMMVASFIFIGATGAATAPGPDTFIPSAILTTLSAVIYIVYFGAQHAASGQTLGKKAGKIRVVRNDNGGPIDNATSYLRALAHFGPNLVSGLSYFTGSDLVIGFVGIVFFIYVLADILFALFDRARQRSLHDRIAGTRVIDLQHA